MAALIGGSILCLAPLALRPVRLEASVLHIYPFFCCSHPLGWLGLGPKAASAELEHGTASTEHESHGTLPFSSFFQGLVSWRVSAALPTFCGEARVADALHDCREPAAPRPLRDLRRRGITANEKLKALS